MHARTASQTREWTLDLASPSPPTPAHARSHLQASSCSCSYIAIPSTRSYISSGASGSSEKSCGVEACIACTRTRARLHKLVNGPSTSLKH
eukprot:8498351-Alexandrium_andersonii.AAC.1